MTDEPAPPPPAEGAPEPVADTPSKQSGRRVPPNPDKPRLPARVERRLAAADERSAAAYEASEDATAQVHAVTEALRDGHVEAQLEVGESLVHFIREHVRGGGGG